MTYSTEPSKTCFYTGLPSYQLFECLFQQIELLVTKRISKNLSLMDEFFLTLVKLHLGIPNDDTAYRMDIMLAQ